MDIHTNYCPNFILLFFLTFCVSLMQLNVEAIVKKQRDCKASLTVNDSYLKCFTSVSGGTIFPFYCLLVDENSIILVAPVRHVPITSNMYCNSNRPVKVKVDYVDGTPEPIFWKMKQKRGSVNFSDPTYYTYFVDFQTPKQEFVKTLRKLKDVIGVKYTISMMDFPDNKIKILWFELESRGAVSFSENSTITVKQEIVNIPCVDAYPDKVPQLYRLKASANTKETFVAVAVNNSSISYHPVDGFNINTSEYLDFEGTFSCAGKFFTFQKHPDFLPSIQLHHLSFNPPLLKAPFVFTTVQTELSTSPKAENKENHSLIFVYNTAQFDLSCTSKIENLTFQYEDLRGTMRQMEDVIYLRNDRPEIMYTAKVTTSTLDRTNKYLKMNCWNSMSGKIYHEWKIFYHDIYSDFFNGSVNSREPKLMVEPSLKNDHLECYARGVERDFNGTPAVIKSLDFIQIECSDKVSCTELAPGLFKSMQTGITYGSFASHLSYYNVNRKSLDPYRKGFFQCSMNNTFPTDNITAYIALQGFYFLGFDNKYYVGDVEPPDEAIMKMRISNKTDEILPIPGSYTFSCEAHSFYFEDTMVWFFRYHNGTQTIIPKANLTGIRNEKRLLYGDISNSLSVSTIKLEENSVQKIICAAPFSSTLNLTTRHSWKFMEIALKTEYFKAPTINTDVTKKDFKVGDKGQVLKCDVDGFPIPVVTWRFNDKDIHPPLKVVGDYKTKLLEFPVYNKSMAGKYVCTARNSAGHMKVEFYVDTHVDNSLGPLAIATIFVSIFIVVTIPIAVFTLRWFKPQNKIVLTDGDIKVFIEGVPDEYEHADKVALSLPYNSELYELHRNQYEIDKRDILGKGAFGIVYKGTVSLDHYNGVVAFKTVKPNSGVDKIKSLLSELKIMIYVGEHENIVRLIAAYTKELQNGIIYIATEYCEFGSLEGFLRSHRDETIPPLDAEKSSGYHSRESPRITKKKLSDWSAQIANGMEYLGFKHIVHSDLATRNILLDSNEVAKITDFGLSRQMYNYYEYIRKEKKELLPWKWLAIESLITGTFSTQSDVWAYGITLWEIYSLGSVPYPGISYTIEFVEMLENGLRNLKPKLADSQIYSVMRSCWDDDPKERPTFSSLRAFFKLVEEIDENKEGETYVELGETKL